MKKKILALLTVALLIVSSINVMAASYQSPTGSQIYTITINGNRLPDGGSSMNISGGKISISDGQTKPGESVTLVAKANSGKKFNGWNISGDYTIISGGLGSTSITIVPRSDLSVNVKFVKKSKSGGSAEKETTKKNAGKDKGQVDDSNKSPKTGNEPFALVLVMLAALVVAASAKRKMS